MKHLLSFARSAAVISALLAVAALTPRDARAQTGKITGVVTDSANGQPIEGVQIILEGTGYGALTQSNGRYFIIALPPGNYTVVARRIGYRTTQTTAAVRIDVTRDINFQLSWSGSTLS